MNKYKSEIYKYLYNASVFPLILKSGQVFNTTIKHSLKERRRFTWEVKIFRGKL